VKNLHRKGKALTFHKAYTAQVQIEVTSNFGIRNKSIKAITEHFALGNQ